MEILTRAEQLLSKRLDHRDMADLTEMTDIKFRIWLMIPMAKKNMRIKELEADTLEKSKFLDYKKAKKEKKTTMSQDDMKALSRLDKNKLWMENIELEHTYLQLYAFYNELQDNVVSTRLLLKVQ